MAAASTASNKAKSALYNNDEAAQYLGIKPRTLEVWRSTKRYSIPYVKVGGLVRYRLESLDKFLESRTVGASKND